MCSPRDMVTGVSSVLVAGDLNLKQREEATVDKTQAVTGAGAMDGEYSWPC